MNSAARAWSVLHEPCPRLLAAPVDHLDMVMDTGLPFIRTGYARVRPAERRLTVSTPRVAPPSPRTPRGYETCLHDIPFN